MTAKWLKRNIPILSWLPTYNRSWLPKDTMAGLTVWGVIIPTSMAYAGVAGLPPQFGLYTLVVTLLLYAVLGTSRQMCVAPTSATAALVASSVIGIMVATGAATNALQIDPAAYQQHAAALAMVVGLLFLIAGIARLGFITQFLSRPVMDGFVTGLAVFVMVGQLYKLFGLEKPAGNTVQKLFTVLSELPDANWATLAVGAAALALLILMPRWNRKIPAGLVVVFGSIALSSALRLNASYGVNVVGALPQGIPSFSMPVVPLESLPHMIGPAIGILLVSFSQSLGVAHEYADEHGYEIDANKELNAFGVINGAAGLFSGQVAGGGMAPSAVNDKAGGRTQVSALVAWTAVIITLLFFTPVFSSLPEAVLAAVVIHALWHTVVARKLKDVRLESRTEFVLGVLTFVGVLTVGVLQGMLIGLVGALLAIILRSSRPHLSRLGRVPNIPGAYSDMIQHPENVPVPGVYIVRLDAPIYYANALTVRDRLVQMLSEEDEPLKVVLFDAAVQSGLDITSSDMLKKLIKQLHNQGLVTYFAEVQEPVLEFSARTGLLDVIGKDNVFSTVEEAVNYIETL